MMMVKYLIDPDAPVGIPGVASPEVDFEDLVAPVALALEQERRVTAQINELTKIAREENDFASDQFMQWFIKEQVEEVATMSDLVAVVRRSKAHRSDRGLHPARAVERGQRPDSPGHRRRLNPRLPSGPEGDSSFLAWVSRIVTPRFLSLLLAYLLAQ